MENLTISESTLDKYFGILESLDINSKKRLIIKLTKSIDSKQVQGQKLDDIFGAWQGTKSAEEIIFEIKDSRYNKREIEEL